MKLGIVGLPNVCKSTLFNSMTMGKAEAANYPFCTIEPNIGIVAVPDQRLDKLTEMYHSAKTVPAVIEFVDIAGLVKGASKGEGLGNQFLSHIREVDAIVHVVRCFEDPNVVHVDGSVNPLRDIETINLELIFSDLEVLERRLSKTIKAAKADKSLQKELHVLEQLKAALESGQSARSVEFDDPDDLAFAQSLDLLTSKPVLYAANVGEEDLADDGASNPHVQAVRELAAKEGSEVFVLCAKMEEELSDLDEEEKAILEEKIIETYKTKGITFDDNSLYKENKNKIIDKEFKNSKEMPKLEDLYNILEKDIRTQKFKTKLIPFIKGSMKFFNEYTNVELDNDLIIADIYDLGEENLKYGMYLFTDIFWDKIKENRHEKKAIY